MRRCWVDGKTSRCSSPRAAEKSRRLVRPAAFVCSVHRRSSSAAVDDDGDGDGDEDDDDDDDDAEDDDE